MPRLKLPPPAKRHVRRLNAAEKIGKTTRNTTLAASAGYRVGYDHARRDANHANQEASRRSQRYRFNFTRFQTLQRERAMSDSTTCPCAACARIREEFGNTIGKAP